MSRATTTTTTTPTTPATPDPGGDGVGFSLVDLSRTLTSLVEGRLWLKVLIGLVCGVVVGVLLGPATGLVSASVGTPSSPGAGVVILASILTSAGIPVAGVALVIGVDHLLGMCRTAVNVMGDLVAAVLFDRRTDKTTTASSTAPTIS